jgi:hypothetical protein
MMATENDLQAVLEARARVLAQPLADVALTQGDLQLVVLQVGDERYALRSEWVEEVQSGEPHHAGAWAGAPLARAGESARAALSCARSAAISGGHWSAQRIAPRQPATSGLFWSQPSGCTVALLVDDVPAVRSLAQTDIEPSLVEPQGALNAMLPGITTDLMTMLDLPAMFADQRLLVGSKTNP